MTVHYYVAVKWKENLAEAVEVRGKLELLNDPSHFELENLVLNDVKSKKEWIREDAEI